MVLVGSVISYGSKIWTITLDIRRKLNAVEIDYIRSSTCVTRIQGIRNKKIRVRLDAVKR